MGRFVVDQDGNLVTCDLLWANCSLRDPDQWHVNALWCKTPLTPQKCSLTLFHLHVKWCGSRKLLRITEVHSFSFQVVFFLLFIFKIPMSMKNS